MGGSDSPTPIGSRPAIDIDIDFDPDNDFEMGTEGPLPGGDGLDITRSIDTQDVRRDYDRPEST